MILASLPCVKFDTAMQFMNIMETENVGKGVKMDTPGITAAIDTDVDIRPNFMLAGGGINSLPRSCRKSCRGAVEYEKQEVVKLVECMGRANGSTGFKQKIAQAKCAVGFAGKVGINRASDWNRFKNGVEGAKEFGMEMNR